jgi:phage shock protein A
MSKLTDSVGDAKLAGAMLREAGPNFILVLSNLLLTMLADFIVIYGVVGPDRWTSADHAEYAAGVAEEQKSLDNQFHSRDKEIADTRTDIRVMGANLQNVQSDIEEIKDLLKAQR